MSLLSSHVAPVVIINAGNACAYVFQVVLARWLSPADVGAFNALLSTVTLVAAPASVVPLAITRIMPLLQERLGADAAPRLVARSTLATLAVCSLIGLVTLLASPLVSRIYNVEHSAELACFAALMALTFAYPVTGGWFQAMRRNVAMAMVLGGVPILRLACGVLLVIGAGYGLPGALASAALPCAIVITAGLAVLWPKRESWLQKLPPEAMRETLRFAIPGVIATTLIYALFNLDVMLVRALNGGAESGLYAIAAVIGRIPFLLPAALANVFFSDLIFSPDQNPRARRRRLLLNLAATGAIALALAAGLALFAPLVLRLAAGELYEAAAPILIVSAFAMAGLSVLNMLVTFSMALDDRRPLAVLAMGVLAFVLTTLAAPGGLVSVAAALAAVIWATTAICLALALQRLSRQALEG